MSGRGEGSQSDEAPGVTAVRQLKIAAPKHKRGEVAVTSSHGAKTTGTELVRKRSEIPAKNVVKTSTTTKPERGNEVEVDKVHTSKPESHYATNQGTSVVVPKNPAYMSPKGKTEKSRAYKKRTTGRTTLTTHPGRSAPPVSQWKQSGHVVIQPRKDEMNSYDRIYSLLVEATRVRSNPGGEEGEELRASFPYKGKGKAYHDREGYEEGEYARSGEWSSPNKSDAPKGHNFSSSRTRKIMGKRKASTPKALPKGTKITGLGSAEGASTKELAQRARDHGRGEDEYEGLKKGDPKYHERAVASAKAGTHKPSWVAQTGDDEVGMGGGRTALRHHQIAGVDPKVDTVSRADMKRAAKSAERRDTAEKSGKLAKIRARLAKDGKTMRESILQAFQLSRKV